MIKILSAEVNFHIAYLMPVYSFMTKYKPAGCAKTCRK
jgi:hypothetical protein